MRIDPAPTLAHARTWLDDHAGDFPAAPLASAVKVATGLVGAASDAPLPPGASRFGGEPDLPPAAAWPRWSKGPLSFLAQLDLATLPDATGLLPDAGTLLFFFDCVAQPWGFDPAHAGGGQVLYSAADPRALTRTAFPADLPTQSRFSARGLAGRPVATLPADAERAGLALDDDDAIEAYAELESGIVGLPVRHQLFGWPAEIQNPMELECQLVSNGIYCGNATGYRTEAAQRLAPGAGEWILLCQLDSDDDLGWMWGDMGRLYFWIERQHLAARRFERAWAILQCG